MHRLTSPAAAVLRQVPLACLLVVLVAFLVGCSTAHMAVKPSALGVTRTDSELDTRWRFVREDVAGAQEVGFDDQKWGLVTLPHTWNALDGQDGGGGDCRGLGWD